MRPVSVLKEILFELQEIRKLLLAIQKQQEQGNKGSDIRKRGINTY